MILRAPILTTSFFRPSKGEYTDMRTSQLWRIGTSLLLLLAACSSQPNQFVELNFDAQVTLAKGFVRTGRHGIGTGVANEFRCPGWYPEEPEHVMTLVEPFSELTVQVRNSDDGDLLLMINSEDDTYCASGDDPSISLNSLSAGTYDIFVGTREPNVEIYYTVEFIE